MDRLNYLDVKKYIESYGYVLLSKEYKNCKKLLYLQCPKGHKYYYSLDNFRKHRKSHGCPECKKEDKTLVNINKHSYESIKEYIENYNYTLLTNKENYKGIKKSITIKCNNGHIFNISFAAFKKRVNKCFICDKENKFNEILLRAKELNYKVVSKEFINTKTKINIICDKNHKISPSYDSFVLKKCKCLLCNEYKGEEKIKEILDGFKIEYIRQYKTDKCRNKKPLPFDFYLKNKNIFIEFDGIQHYEPIEYFDGKEGFERTKKNDEIKNQFCIDNNIKLIRIPYYDFNNIENIIRELINKYE